MQKSNIMTDEGSCHSLTARSFAVDGVPGTIPGGVDSLMARSVEGEWLPGNNTDWFRILI